MVLTLAERIGLLFVLPKQGDLLTGRIVQDLQRNLSPNEQEFKDANIRNTAGGLAWDMGEAIKMTKVVPIGEKAKEIIAAGIEQLATKGLVDFQWLDLYGKFVELPPLPEPEIDGHKEQEE